MRRLFLPTLFSCLVASAAWADGALLQRLSTNVEAPTVVRPQGQNAVVGVLLQDLGGQAGRVTTFGQVFRAGDWPQGTGLGAEWNGRAVPIQTDIKARHADGSVRHAIISLVNPDTSSAQISLRGGSSASAGAALPIDSILRRGYDLKLDLQVSGRRLSVDAAALLRQALGRGEKPWLSGPLATEIRVKEKLSPELTAILDIRALASGAVRTSVAVHNDDMFASTGKDIAYRATVRMGGQTMVDHQLTHRRFANWREIVWAGAAPSRAHVVYDYPYMIAAGAVPAWDPELDINRAFFENATAIDGTDTGPMGNAMILKAMPTSGGRHDIGMVPDWTLAWLRSQSPAARAAMMGNAEAAGAIPWHIRDPKTMRVPVLDDHPRYWLDARANQGTNGHGPMVTDVEGWNLDNAHQPEMAYVPYLISGDRHLLDELIAQTAFALFSYDANPGYRDGAEGNLTNDEVRGQSWANRTHGYAAFITPDNHPEKSYLTGKLRQRLLWYPRAYTARDDLGGPARYETSGWIEGPYPLGHIANWQQDFFSQSLAQIARMGFSEALPVYNYTRKYQLSRFLRSDFNPLWATHYATVHADKQTDEPFATWREIAQANLADGNFEQNPRIQNGHGDKAWDYAAQGRAGYASLVGGFRDPLIAEAYARLVHGSILMQSNSEGFQKHPKWGIVPVFPDGSTLAIANHRVVSGQASGSSDNELLAGSPNSDTIYGVGGNNIIAGFDGDDLIAGGTGISFLAGGRGNDRIVIEGALTYAAGGPGADVFFFGRKAQGGAAGVGVSEIFDFTPGTDRLSLPPQLGDPRRILSGARAQGSGTLIPLGNRASILLRGVRPNQLREDSLASR